MTALSDSKRMDRFPFGCNVSNCLALFGVVLFGLGAAGFTSLMYLSFAPLISVAILEARYARAQALSQPFVPLLIILTTVIIVRVFFAIMEHPESTEIIEKRGGQFLMISGIPAILVAWSLKKDIFFLKALLFSYCIGLTFFLFFQGGFEYLLKAITEEERGRLFFGGHKSAIGAMYSLGVIFLAWLLITPPSPSVNARGMLTLKFIYLLAVLILLATFILVVIFNQSRTNWIGLGAALLFLLFKAGSDSAKSPYLIYASSITVIALISIAAYWSGDIFASRLAPIFNNLNDALTTSIGEPSSSSLETRMQIFKAAWISFLDRPWIGWGPWQYDLILKSLGGDSLVIWGHFHNLYLQVLVAYGLPLFMLFVYAFAKPFSLISRLETTWSLAIACLLFVAIIGLADLRHDDPVGQALYIITLAIPAAHIFAYAAGKLMYSRF